MKIKNLKSQALTYWNNPKIKQTLTLFSVNIISIPIGIVTSVILSKYLGANGYGNYQFLDSLFNLSVIIFTFGLFYAANRALVLNDDKVKAREYFGATLIILGGLFLIMSLVLIFYALFDTNLKAKNLDRIVLYSIPLGWVYLALNYFETLFQADNRINLLATARILPKLGFLVLAGCIYFFLMNSSYSKLPIAWGAYVGIQALAYIFVIYKINISFKNLKSIIKEIWAYNKSYGFHVYIGSAFSVGVAQLTGVIISYFGNDNSGVGFYALALALATPLQFIPNTIATTNYKLFSTVQCIPKKLTQVTLLLTACALIGLWLVIPFFINYFYSEKFHPVIFLNMIVSVGLACYGIADYFNRFLGAHGHGKLLRNTSFIVGSLILCFNFILIPLYGATGAALTRMLGGIAYLLCMIYYYKKTIKLDIIPTESTLK